MSRRGVIFSIDMAESPEFSTEQKNYLQGFVSGSDIARGLRGLPTFGNTLLTLGVPQGVNAGPKTSSAVAEGPDASMHAAQDRWVSQGNKLTPEETAKRQKHPLDRFDEIASHSREGRYPKGTDVLMFKYHGLFYVAPAQNSYMCRLRFPGGMMKSGKARDLAEACETFGGGYVDCTTRGNLQIREIKAEQGVELLNFLFDAGIVPRGSGADNIRNITGTPTAGIDTQELIDVRPLCAAMQAYIYNNREMYNLPRKFNIAFDGGGTVSSLEDTNDIGFEAVRLPEGKSVEAGVYFRLALGGITGHQDFARDTGVMVQPSECVPVAAAILRVFLEHGNRGDRKKARLKYVLDEWGFDKFLSSVEEKLGRSLLRFPLSECERRAPVLKHGHVGVHPQKQDGKFYIGVVLPVGRMRAEQLRGLASIADRYGSGLLRLTVWQNLLISDISHDKIERVQAEIEELGLHHDASSVRGGLVACTGAMGCKYASTLR